MKTGRRRRLADSRLASLGVAIVEVFGTAVFITLALFLVVFTGFFPAAIMVLGAVAMATALVLVLPGVAVVRATQGVLSWNRRAIAERGARRAARAVAPATLAPMAPPAAALKLVPAAIPMGAPGSSPAGPDAAAVGGIDIFRGLSLERLARIAAIARPTHVPEGWTMGREGEPGARFYGILSGQVQLAATSPAGEITVRVAGEGESLPLAAFLGSRVLITNAYAMTDVEALEFDSDSFLDLCHRDPVIGMHVYGAIADGMSDRYRNTLGRLVATLGAAHEPAEVLGNV